MLVLLLLVSSLSSYVQSFTAVLPPLRLHTAVPSQQQSTVRWMTTAASNDDADVSKKDPIEVVEEYRDNLSNSRTAPGHHDGQEKKVNCLKSVPCFDIIG
jgi:hypothetical protein